MPQAQVVAEQLRENPPKTAGRLIPGRWEADFEQGGDMHVESTQQKYTDMGVK